jgi:ribonuclease P protein component
VKHEFRITRSTDIKRVRRFGKSYTHSLAVLSVLQTEGEKSRAGFITGKSVGNAVKRNRAKRQLRAIIYDFIPHFQKSADILLIAREPIQTATFNEIEKVVKQLLIRAELINPEPYDAGRPTS